MKRLALTFIFFISFVATYAQSLPTKKEQYDFLKWYTTSKHLEHVSTWPTTLDEAKFNAGDKAKFRDLKIYTTERTYLLKQISKNSKLEFLDTITLANVKWKKPGDSEEPVTHISLPIFTRDRKLAIVNHYYSDYHNGNGFTNWGVETYVKVKHGTWRQCSDSPFMRYESAGID